MNYLSLFSGVGGFELGIQRAIETANCIGFSEIDKYAIQTYEKNWKGHTNYGSVTTINERELPDFDLLVGGFPCQAFSVAGKRAGFNDTRGTLFFDIARVLKHKRPRHILLENVKGLLSHDSGKTMQTIAGVLTDLGYRIEWQVLNAKNFGVPQNRERIFIVGHLGGECAGQVFPVSRHYDEVAQISEGEISGTIDTGYAKNHRQSGATYIVPTIRATQHKSGDNQTVVAEINVVGELDNETWSKRHESIRRVHGTDGISPTIPTGTGGGVMTKIAAPVLTPDRLVKRQNGRRFKDDGEPSFTLNTQDKHGIYDGMRIRRLTPTECERLMSWPDGWTEGVSDTQRYKQCGNGVVSNCVQAVVEKMLEVGCL